MPYKSNGKMSLFAPEHTFYYLYDQSFEFLLNNFNFARLSNIISEECPTFALFKSVFRLHLLYVVFKKVKGLENFEAFAFHLKLRVNRGMLRFSIAFRTV